MSQEIIVYGLQDPRTKEIRYVGRSSSWKTRPDAHRRAARKGEAGPKCDWIRELLAAGLDYEMIVLEECDTMEEVMEAERKWIAEGWRLGWPLLNRTMSPQGAITLSAETRAKIAASKRGKPRYDLRGKPNPGVSAALRVRERGEPWRKKMEAVWESNKGRANPRRGVPISAEHKAKISAGKTGTSWSPAMREAQRLRRERERLASATSSACPAPSTAGSDLASSSLEGGSERGPRER